ncbi:calmodulin-regulated spectrin-associated protein 1-like isoform X8 [Acanthaster planci]|uniref:Calmodulin-regulated spectrin-associated protein 1-like isoform X8 n=1 Tax=Acanthaster planci TaxID=133434 RepID=A0A8B7YD43_ACAPL|nr:calmodulin-regulated spectrin-associated protein 1-like isoform X8 [Acanthaster planci]
MALNHRDNSRARSLSSSSASSYHSLDRGSSLTSEIMPIGQYNSKKAKLCASIRWLVSKAYSSSTIPPDIRNPFFKDKEGEDHLRPAVIYQLSSGELYSRACANIFPPSLHQWQGHWSVIQGLSRRGIYVVDDRRQPVTEAVLTQTQRIKLNAHLAVMDSIMTAYTGEVVSIEKIVQAVRRITTFNASSELPFDLENALVFWVNKVCVAARHRMERERRSQQEQAMQTQAQKVRIKRQHLQLKEMPGVPIIKNVTKDISDGRSLCLLIHYYCPQHFSLDDVDLHDTMSFADSVNNLQQVENFLEQHLPETHHFTFEDLLYSPEALRVNILALTAELFYWFEVARPPRLGFSQELGQKFPVTPESGRSRVQQLPPLPISSATKKSFHGDAPSPRSELRSAASNPEVNRITSASPQRTQSLLVHRERKPRNALHAEQGEDGPSNLRRASSLENMEARESFLAWQSREEARDRSQTFGTPSPGSAPASTVRDSNTNNLLAKVSIDSDMNDSHNFSELGGMPNLNGQLSKEGNDSGEGLMSSSAHFENEDDLEVESLTSALSRISQQTEKPVSCSYSEEVQLPSRSPGGENGISADQELTNVTPLSSMSSRPSQSLNSETGRMDLLDQTRDRIGQSRTNGSGEFGHPEAIEPETDMRAVTQSRRRLKLDIEPVDTKQTERLLPAVVRPLKEKSRNVNKKEESGEGRRIARNPREDRSGRSPNPNGSNMTTWSRKQSAGGDGGGNLTQSGSLAAGDLAQIRSRLEEKRRLMDSDKRKLERHWSKQRQRMGKAAFLQVLANQKRVKDPVAGDQPVGTEDDRSMIGEKTRSQDVYSREELERSIEKSRTQWASNQAQQEGKITFADLGSSKEKQLSNWSVADSPRSQRPTASSQLADRPESPPGISEVAAGKGSPGSSSGSHSPHMTSDEYNTSLEKLNANLSQLQNEIQRLSLQQEQMRSVMESPRPPSERSQSPQHAPPADSKPFILHAGSDPPATSQGFFLSSDTNKEPESFVLHENPVYEMSGADMQMHSPRPVGPVQKLAPEVGQGSITRPVEQPKIPKSPYPANQVPSSSPDNTYIIPPAQTPVKNIVSETPKNEVPQNITHVVASTPANEPPRNADALANQHQPPLPTVASLSNHMAQMSNKEQSLASPVEAVEVVKRPKKNREATSPTRKKRSSLYEIVGEGEDDDENLSEDEHLVVRPLDSTGNSSLDAKTKAKGFVIASETDQLDEVERRKMLFLQNRLKKQEEEKAKRASREADMEKKREQNRRKQEEMEAKKAEERARREQIRLEYQRRKLQEQQQENEPAPARRAKPTKPRPKSTVVEDQTDFGRPATSRYAPDRDLDNYSAPKKSFTVSAPSSGGGSGAESQVKVPPVDGPEQAAEKPGPPASPKQQGVCPEASEAATPAKSPATESKTENKLAERPLVAKQPPVAKQQPSPQSPKAKEPPCLTPPLQKENQLQVKGQLEEVAGGSSAASVVSQDSNGSGGGGGHTTPEYQGPKLYVKPTSKSNRHIITNAISHCVLAGTVNREQKDKVLEELAKAEAKHFIILFRDSQLQFRSLYGYSPDSEELTKLYGVGPRHITHKMYENLYKYNSGSKQFSKIPSKTMSVSVDGLTIGASYWLSKKGPSKKK